MVIPLLFALVLVLPVYAGAETIVYVTDECFEYHQQWCGQISGGKYGVPLLDARAQGYEPCSVCAPPTKEADGYFDDWEAPVDLDDVLCDPETGRYIDSDGNVYAGREEYLDTIAEDYDEIDCCEECFGIDGEHAEDCPTLEEDYSPPKENAQADAISSTETDDPEESENDTFGTVVLVVLLLVFVVGPLVFYPAIYLLIWIDGRKRNKK